MNDLFDWFMVVFLAIVAAIFTCVVTLDNVADDCETFNKVKINGHVYECRLLESAQ